MEFKVPQSHQLVASLQSLLSEESSSSTDVDTSDTDTSASTTSAKSRDSGRDQEENTYVSKGKTNKLKISSSTAAAIPQS